VVDVISHRHVFAVLGMLAASAVAALVLPRSLGSPLLVIDLIIAFALVLWLLGTDAWRDAMNRRRSEHTDSRSR
jgi:hypothetical protein